MHLCVCCSCVYFVYFRVCVCVCVCVCVHMLFMLTLYTFKVNFQSNILQVQLDVGWYKHAHSYTFPRRVVDELYTSEVDIYQKLHLVCDADKHGPFAILTNEWSVCYMQ